MTKPYSRGPESPVILTHGAWVRRGLTMVWQPHDEAQQPEVTELRREDPIACPVCFARTTQQCRTTDGTPTRPHNRRLRRACKCGEPRAYRALECATCLTRFDESVVERLLDGERLDSRPAEKTEALRRWLETGGSERSFCRMHGWKHGRYTPAKSAA